MTCSSEADGNANTISLANLVFSRHAMKSLSSSIDSIALPFSLFSVSGWG